MEFKVSVQIDFGADVGQDFGGLFEARDGRGSPIAGAGFLGGFNTDARSDRRVLHAFVRPRTSPPPRVERLPRPTSDAGVYLHSFDGKVYARGRAGRRDPRLYSWDDRARQWTVDPTTVPLSIHVADGVLAVSEDRVSYKGRPILELPSGAITQHYYAGGSFVFRHHDSRAALNRLVACPWKPGARIDLPDGRVLDLRSGREFVYACGQLGQDVVITTNTGGVYVFDGRDWHVVLEPVPGTSFQVYTAIHYRDRLLMGQYPTGELWEYSARTLRQLDGWPPVMEGVSTRAREAQTAALYGGDLYVGVWPWAELWKYDGRWTFVRRLFTHPEPTREVVHPYETETAALDDVRNRWGQRITSLVSHGDSLYIATSAKTSQPYEPRFDFLSSGRWEEYGAVYRLTTPGHLSVATTWSNGPTRFEIALQDGCLHVSQDGRTLGSTSLEPALTDGMRIETIAWGDGLYGRFRGAILEKSFD